MMKQLHLLHIIALITLFCAGAYWIGAIEKAGRIREELPYDNEVFLTRLAAVAAIVVFAFSAIVGWKVYAERKILGTIWGLLGLGAVCWMVLMWLRPSHISLVEVFPFWLLYIILGTIGSAYSISTWKGAKHSYTDNYEDDLLDA